MGNVFNSVIAIGTRANAMVADMKNADFKELNPKQMTQQTGIGPVAAIDTKLVFGPQCEYVRGYRDLHITSYDKRQIDNYLKETANDQCWQTYKQGHTLTVGVYDKTEITGTRDVHVTGEDVENYDVHREITEPVKFETSKVKMEWTWFTIDTKGLLLEGVVSKIAVVGLVAEIEAVKSINDAIKNKLEPLNNKISGLEGKLGAFCAKAIATYDALPHPSILAPFD